jgi:hypothetical protein
MSPSGPKTAAGKAAVARNAVTHGIFSQEPVVKDVESQEEWEAHRDGIIASLAPVGALEETLAERAALLLWRQARVARFEMYCIDRWQQEIEEDLKFKYQLEVGTTSPEARTNCSPEQIRTIHQQRQQFLLLLRRFPELTDDAFLTYQEASDIGEAVLTAAGDQGDLSIDGEPGEQPEDLPRVRVGTLRAGLQQVAKRAGIHIAELWALTAQQAIKDAAWQAERAERLEGYFPVWHAYRVVPREEELQKVMRYEAHLSRELARLLKDFHHLQKQRRAMEAPKADNCETNDAKGEKEPPSPSALGPQPSAPVPYALCSMRSEATPTPERLHPPTPQHLNTPTPSPTPVETPQHHNCKTDPPASSATLSPEPSAPTPSPAATEPSEADNCKANAEASPPSALSAQPSAPTPERLNAPHPGRGNRRTGSAAPQNCRTNSHRGKHKGRRM